MVFALNKVNAKGRGVVDFLLASDLATAKEVQPQFPDAKGQAAPPDKGKRQGWSSSRPQAGSNTEWWQDDSGEHW